MVVTTSPGDGPDICHVLAPAQKWQNEVPLTQYVMSQWMAAGEMVGAAVAVLVLLRMEVDVLVAGRKMAVAEPARRREMYKMGFRENIVGGLLLTDLSCVLFLLLISLLFLLFVYKFNVGGLLVTGFFP